MTLQRPKFTPVYGMVAFTLLLTIAMLSSLLIGRSMSERYAPLADATMEIKLEATTGHLWFEELISGDRYIDLETIFKHFDQSEWYAQAMLEGGENQEGRFVPLENPALREKIEQTLNNIRTFKEIAKQRWETRADSGIGSVIDQRFDQVFANFLTSADEVETILQQEMGNRLQQFQLMQTLLLIAVLTLGLFFAALLRRHEQARFNHLLALQEKEVSLRQLRNYLSNIIDSMPSVLVGVDSEGKVTQWNYEAARATGISVEEALGQHLPEVFPRMSVEMERVKEAINSRQMQLDSQRGHLENGENHYEDVTIYPLIANGIEGAVIRIDDVTERVRIEEMMVQSEKMLSVGGLAAGMAHEINNPLAGMTQTASVLVNRLTGELSANDLAAKEAGTSMAVIQSYMQSRGIPLMLDRIQSSGARVAEIVLNMLNFARKGGTAFSSHDLNTLLDRTVELANSDYDLKRKYDFRKISIVNEYAEKLPAIPCDASMIQQVLLNILRNGAEAMWERKDQNEPRFILRTSHETDDRMIRLEIEDNGPGMDENTCKRIFDPFFTTKPVGMGTGLGLSVSYFIVTENHGGKLDVESQPGHGTKFILHLPLG